MDKKQEIAVGIALQTQVLKVCPSHNQLYCDDETYSDDDHLPRAFAVASELVRRHAPYAKEFHRSPHELIHLLSYIIGAAPACCPACASP
jgi:hypothetical protein